MWPKISRATITLLAIQAAAVSAADGFHSSGPATPCSGYHLTNSTKFDFSITPDNGTIYLDAQGLSTITGNVTIGLAIIADGSEKYKANLDPCTVGIVDLCPAIDGIANVTTSLSIPQNLVGSLDLSSDEDVKAQLWLNNTNGDSQQHMACVETALRSDANTDGSGATNSTSIDGGNSSTNANSTDSAGTTKDSSASPLHATWSIAM